MKWLAVLAAGVLATVCCPTGAPSAAEPTVTIAVPKGGGPDWCLNELLTYDCDQFWNGVFEAPVIRGAFKVGPGYAYRPDLVSKVIVRTHPLRLRYAIRPRAVWSDGVPVTAEDWRFTWRRIMDPRMDGHVDRSGYDRIASVIGSGKAAVVTFRRPYGDWKSLFRYVLPEHALAGSEIATVWSNGIVNPKTGQPIGDGPYLLARYDRSGRIVLERNSRWWGRKPQVGSLAFRVIANLSAVWRLLRSGEIDAYYSDEPHPLPLGGPDVGLRIQADRGSRWVQLAIDQGPRGQPLAKKLWVREAIAYALDRRALAAAALGPFWDTRPLNSVIYLADAKQYVPHWEKWKPDPPRAESILRAHGCVKGADGIYECSGVLLSFDIDTSSTTYDASVFDVIQRELAQVGIETRLTFFPHGGLGNVPSALELMPEDDGANPSASAHLWECGGSLITQEICDHRVDRLLRTSETTVDSRRRAALRNRADALLSDELWTLPLFQLPAFFVYHPNLTGVVDNPGVGPTWNAEDWRVAATG